MNDVVSTWVVRSGCGVLIGVVLAGAPGCDGGDASTPPAARPRFEPAACSDVPFPAPPNARCGFLVVPENRTKSNRRSIRLAVAIVPAVSQRPAPDPVVYLSGGPGGSAIGEAQLLVAAGVNRDRDLILMNERGTQCCEPALTCPEVDQFFVRNLGLVLDAPSTRRLNAEAAGACYRRLAAQDIDLGAYNTTENAADFADLRLEGPQSAYRAARGSAQHHPDPGPLRQLRRRHPAELGKDRRPDALQRHRGDHSRCRPFRDPSISLRTRCVRFVPLHSERAGHGLRRRVNAPELHQRRAAVGGAPQD